MPQKRLKIQYFQQQLKTDKTIIIAKCNKVSNLSIITISLLTISKIPKGVGSNIPQINSQCLLKRKR
jgi:hypothetical protein